MNVEMICKLVFIPPMNVESIKYDISIMCLFLELQS